MTPICRLHCFKESGNSYKVALALTLAEIAWEKVDVAFFQGATRDPVWHAEVNEFGEVPVLEIDGLKLSQSGVILTHLSEQVNKLRVSPAERLEVLRWLLFDNHKFTGNLASYRWLRTFAKSVDEAVLTFVRQRTTAAFDTVERHFSKNAFLVGGRLTIADLSLAGYVFYPPEELGLEIKDSYPHVWKWMGRISEIPGWHEPYGLLR